MPRYRLIGNTLNIIYKVASGYFHIMDPQMGYTTLKQYVKELKLIIY